MKGINLMGNRISLSPVLAKDAECLVGFYNEVRNFIRVAESGAMTLAEEKDFIRDANRAEDKYFFAIRLNSTSEIIGTISVFDISRGSDVAETGTMIGLDYVGKGYGSEAKHLMLDWAFNRMGLRRIYSRVFSFNERSLEYTKNCGYKHEATKTNIGSRKGRSFNEEVFFITQKLWEPTFKKYAETFDKKYQ